MNHRKVLRSAFAFVATLLLSASANALLFRAYLDSTGNDADPCTLPQPCRLLPAALAAITDGGEVWMLDSANYNSGTVTVGKSVSILAIPGAVGSVVALGGPAISITASGLTVSLRNLVIVPFPGSGGTDGVNMTGASTLTIENSLIANIPQYGVNVIGTGTVNIMNSIIRNSGGRGVSAQNGGHVTFANSKMLGNPVGIWAHSLTATTTTATISDSFFSGGEPIISSTDFSGAVSQVFVTRSTIEGAIVGLECTNNAAGGSALITVNASTIVRSGYGGFYQSGVGSVIRTMGNNQITDNSGSPVGVLTATALQ